MADESKAPQEPPKAQNTQRPLLATNSPLEVFEYEDLRIDHRGTEVPVGKVKAVTEAAKRQNVDLTELN